MKILFAGLGSIGTRHIRNLSRILDERGEEFTIDCIRSSERPLPGIIEALLSNSYTDPKKLPDDYDVAFVTNPTVCHADTIRELTSISRDLFIEKPITMDPSVDIDSLGFTDSGVYYVACPLRHKRIVKRLKELCADSSVSSARTVCSSYLPDWRPGEDYSECYSAKKELGGGVPLDLIHEWDYISYIFGLPLSVKAFSGKFSNLSITSDDTAEYIALYPDKLVSLHLDYTGRVPQRYTELVCSDDVIIADLLSDRITCRLSGRTEEFPEEDFYVSEMEYFLGCVKDRTTHNINTPRHALEVLKLATTF